MPRSKPYSKACLLCLDRRVKCDETKPGCQRCEKYGAICPGYRDLEAPIFVNQNEAAKIYALKEHDPRSQNRVTGEQYYQKSLKRLSVVEDRACLANEVRAEPESIPASIPRDFEYEGLCQFLERFTLSGKDDKPGFFDFIPELLSRADHAPYFTDAMSALGKVAMANRFFELDHLRPSSRRSFGRALSSLQKALNDPETARGDHVLGTTLLCSQYELISGEKPTLFESHYVGQNILIRLRGPSQLETAIGRSLFSLVKLRNHSRNLVETFSPSQEVQDLPTATLRPANECAALMSHWFKAASPYLALAQNLLASPDGNGTEAAKIALKLIEYSSVLDSWNDTVSGTYASTILINDPSLYTTPTDQYSSQSNPFLQTVTVPTSLYHGAFWCHHWSGRIQILRIALLCMERCEAEGLHIFPKDDDADLDLSVTAYDTPTRYPSKQAVRSALQRCVNQMCALAPYMLCKLKPHIGAIAAARHCPPPQCSCPTAPSSHTPTCANHQPNDRSMYTRPMFHFNIEFAPPCPSQAESTALEIGISTSTRGFNLTQTPAPDSAPASAMPSYAHREPLFPPQLIKVPGYGIEKGNALGALFLVQTLYPAGLVTCISKEQQEWIQERLVEIGRAVGIRQGLVLGEKLRDLRKGKGQAEREMREGNAGVGVQ